jgi:hypothetical protein
MLYFDQQQRSLEHSGNVCILKLEFLPEFSQEIFDKLFQSQILKELSKYRIYSAACIPSVWYQTDGELEIQSFSFFEIERRPAPPSKLLCVATISPLKNQLGLIHSLQAFPLAK